VSKLAALEDAGVTRGILIVPSADDDKTLMLLDAYADTAEHQA
jgi:hypothetical protein